MPKTQHSSQPVMRLSSSAFNHGDLIPIRFTCKGDNVSPPLEIEHVPMAAKSLALIVHDPDAIRSDWVHWLVWNIDAVTTKIPADSVPIHSVEGTTSFDEPGYGGPCPPAGTGVHRYIFELYALNKTLDLPEQAHRTELEAAMKNNILAKSSLTGLVSGNG